MTGTMPSQIDHSETTGRPPRRLPAPFRILREERRTYLLLNAIVYGVLLIGFGVGVAFPDLSAARTQTLQDDGTADLVLSLLSNPWLFALTILGINVSRIGLLAITLPSLVVPFAGVAVFLIWTVVTGVTLAPADEVGWVALIPHSLTVVIELQAYILLVLGAWILGRSWVRPATVGAPNRRRGYLRGLQRLGWLSLPALVLLIIGAVYEAFSLVYLVPELVRALL